MHNRAVDDHDEGGARGRREELVEAKLTARTRQMNPQCRQSFWPWRACLGRYCYLVGSALKRTHGSGDAHELNSGE